MTQIAKSVALSCSKTLPQGGLLNSSWYGVERDNTQASPDWTRIASSPADMALHASLPVHALFKPCVMKADKTVNYYLNPTDLSKKADGTASNLTGADGNVMSHQSASYWIFYEKVGTVERMAVSVNRQTGAGWSEVTPQFYSCYEGKVVAGKLSSIVGMPTTSTSEINFRIAARANGVGFEQQWMMPYRQLVNLFQIQFATNNFQKPVNLTPTVQGYSQGGLGNGITTAVSAEWNTFNGYNPFISTGSCNTLAKHWGEASVVVPNFGGAGVNRTFTPNRFLFVENIFGHIWKWIDGVTINHLADRREAYVFDNPAQFVDGSSVNGRLAGLLPSGNGYMATSLFPEILPATTGDAGKYGDYLYQPALGSGWRALLSGGHAYYGGYAGAFCAYTHNAASNAYARIGARLHVK